MHGLADVLCQVVHCDLGLLGNHIGGGLLVRSRLLPHEAERHLSTDLLQQLPQVPYSGLPGVVADHFGQGLLVQVQPVRAHATRVGSLRYQVLIGDGNLLLVHVAGNSNDLHSIEKWPGDRVRGVRGAHEEHPRKVHWHVQVVVPESAVLLRVKNLQEGRRRVSAVVPPELVDLVDEHHRVRGLQNLQGLDELAGHGADVGTSVPSELGNIVHASDGEAVELAVEGSGDALADGGLADAWRADEAHDLALDRILEEAHSHMLQNALFDILQSVMVLVEDLLGLGDVLVLNVELSPRQASQPFQVGPGDVELGEGGLQGAQPLELGLDDLRRLLGQHLVLDGLLELGDQGLLFVLLVAELLFDLLHLLHQHHALLVLGDLFLDLALHFGLDPRKLEVPLGDHEDLVEPRQNVVLLEDGLQVCPLRQGHACCEVGELRRVL
mmetsp:Transcript_105620/g.305638  ORF Transcript_105620/g.305638 Transcript_105620/m.305638 type:complete len:439 (-) Transcript_105620:898-2214(-)